MHVRRDAVAEDLARDRRPVGVFVAEGLSLGPQSDLPSVGGDAGEGDAGVPRDGVGAGVCARLEHRGHEEVLDALVFFLFLVVASGLRDGGGA